MQGPLLVDDKAVAVAAVMEESLAAAAAVVDAPALYKKGEFPPPLSSLARKSYNHLPLQVPWKLMQANRRNNRVVLHEVKTAHTQQMLFQQIRKDGRLVLQMLCQDSEDELDECSSTDGESVLSSLPSTASVEGESSTQVVI